MHHCDRKYLRWYIKDFSMHPLQIQMGVGELYLSNFHHFSDILADNIKLKVDSTSDL